MVPLLQFDLSFGKVFQASEDFLQEAHGISTVKHPVIVRQTKGKHDANSNFFLERDRLRFPLADAYNRHLRGIDNRREMAAADTSLIRDRKGAALKLFQRYLPLSRFFREFVQ